jgi:hypothetical protein
MAKIRSLSELAGEERYLSGMLPLGNGFMVKSGYIYMPALYSEGIEKAIAEAGANPTLAMSGKNAFVQSLDLRLLVENYERINPAQFEKVRKNLLARYDFDPSQAVKVDQNLRTIIYEVMPHFTKHSAKGQRGARRLTEREIIDNIASSVSIPQSYYDKAEQLYDSSGLVKEISKLESKGGAISTPDNITSAGELDNWFLGALEGHILSRELGMLKQALVTRSEVSSKNKEYIATLLFLQEKRSFEMEGFGFIRNERGSTPDYTVYVHTGEYALKDFNGNVHPMGDCKVAISTQNMWPNVMSPYHHPFLSGSGGQLCIVGFRPPERFNGENAVSALTTGLDTVFYGYIKKSDFHPHNHLEGGDYPRISENDPRIKSGEIEIKNASLV